MDRVVFKSDARLLKYRKGEVGYLVGFCTVGDREIVAIVRQKTTGHYVQAPLGDIIYNG